MQYNLYFHDDVDGTISGALFLSFLRERGDDIAKYFPLDFRGNFKDKWPEYDIKSPSIIVDFLYHPNADWWLDHHGSSFIKDDWKANFAPDRQHDFAPNEKSCAGQVYRFLEYVHGAKWPNFWNAVIEEADIADSATYPTVDYALDLERPLAKLSSVIDHHVEDPESGTYVELKQRAIESISRGELEQFVNLTEFAPTLNKRRSERNEAFRVLEEKLELDGRVAVYDELGEEVRGGRFVPFAIYPQCKYAAILFERDGDIVLRVSQNPWQDGPWPLDLGEMAKKYGGGGHKGIGIFRFKSANEAQRELSKMPKFLNREG